MGYSFVSGAESLDLSITEFNGNYEHPPLTIKQKVIERYGRDGGDITGDRRIASRKFKMTLNIAATNDNDYYIKAAAVYSIVSKDELYLHDGTAGYRLKMSVGNISIKTEARKRAELWTIDAVCQDAAWETIEPGEIIDEYDEYEDGVLWENNQELIVSNTNPLDSWPVFELTSLGANPEFAIVNVTTGAVLRMGESQFTEGAVMILDGRNGAAYIAVEDDDPIDCRNKIADNTGFPILAPGENVLRYESNFASVLANVTYRIRRPF